MLQHRQGISGQGLAAVVIWGASFAATRVALRGFDPFGLVTIRMLAGALLLYGVLWLRGGLRWPGRSDFPVGLLLGAVLSAHLLIQAYGLKYTSAGSSGWIIGFIPVMIALGSSLLGLQRFSRLSWLGVFVGTGGILAVVLAKSPDFQDARFGNLLQIASCVTWTIYTLAAVGPMARQGVVLVTAFSMVVAGVFAAPATLFTGFFAGRLAAPSLLSAAFLGLICSGVAYYLWFAAVDERGPASTGSLLYVEPFVAAAVGAVLLGESVQSIVVLGGVAVLAGVWLVAKGAKVQGGQGTG